MSRAGYRAPVVEYCGGTEIGGGYVTGTVVQPASPATFSTPALGLDLVILDQHGQPAAEGADGEVLPGAAVDRPVPQTLLNRDHTRSTTPAARSAPAVSCCAATATRWRASPAATSGRTRADDTMNLGGIKVSSVELEAVLVGHPAVAECAAVAVQPEGEGADRLVVFVVLREPGDPAALQRELGRLLAGELNPLFKVHDVVVADSLPRTASNKLMRRALRAQYLRQ